MKANIYEQANQYQAWLYQARQAIKLGVGIISFVGSAHPSNRKIARKAYLHALKFSDN